MLLPFFKKVKPFYCINLLKLPLMATNPEQEPNYKTLTQHINKYIKPSNTQAFLSLGINVVIEIVALTLVCHEQRVLGWTLHFFNLVRFFVQFHDMAHFSFF